MKFFVDAQLPPNLAKWITAQYGIEAVAVRHLDIPDWEDESIFKAARSPGGVVLTKDVDFCRLVNQFGIPPQIVWLRCGNLTNPYLEIHLGLRMAQIIEAVNNGDSVIEVR